MKKMKKKKTMSLADLELGVCLLLRCVFLREIILRKDYDVKSKT